MGFRVSDKGAWRHGQLQGNTDAVSYPCDSPEGPYTLTMELGPKKAIPILVFGDLIP